MNEETDISYKAFFCLATIYRHSRNYSELRELIERAEADSRYNNRISLKHIRVMYETHSESLYDYDELSKVKTPLRKRMAFTAAFLYRNFLPERLEIRQQ